MPYWAPRISKDKKNCWMHHMYAMLFVLIVIIVIHCLLAWHNLTEGQIVSVWYWKWPKQKPERGGDKIPL